MMERWGYTNTWLSHSFQTIHDLGDQLGGIKGGIVDVALTSAKTAAFPGPPPPLPAICSQNRLHHLGVSDEH